MPTYPITLPSSPSFTSLSFNAHSAVAVSTSKFSGQQVVYSHAGKYWEVEFDLPPLSAAQSGEWASARLSLNGREGTFYLTPSDITPQSTVSGTITVTAKVDYTITLAGITGSFTAGDWLEIDGGLYRVTIVNSSTEIEVWPTPRFSVTPTPAPVTYTNPKGKFRTYDSFSWQMDLAKNYGISIAAREEL